MSIITISRGSYSRGKEVAEQVAERLGYPCISREILLEASQHYNIPEIKLIRSIHDAPSILDRLNKRKQHYVSYIRAALLDHVRSGNLVYHGLAGHLLLGDLTPVLKIRIIAQLETRAREEMKREGISLEQAIAQLRCDDEERRRWSLALYGQDSWDPNLYDMTLFVDQLTVSHVVDAIASISQLDRFQVNDETKAGWNDLHLQARVAAHLQEHFSNITSVRVKGCRVVVKATGNFSAVGQTSQEIAKVVREIPGVEGLHVEVTPIG